MPAPLAAQISSTQEMVQALGFSLLTEIGVEADDVIGTLAKQAEAAGMSVLIFTGDKDFAQLVNTSITIADTMRKVKTRLDAQGVQKKFGVPPELIIDYLALIGDKVDNIPGVNTVGPKTAIKWLKTYGNLDAVIEKSSEFKGKVGDYLREAIPHLPLTRQLLTIKCDVPLPYTPQQLKLNPPDIEKLRQLYTQFEFNKLLEELPEPTPQNVQLSGLSTTDQNSSPLKKNVEKLDTPIENISLVESAVSPVEEQWVVSPTTKKYQIILAQAELDDWLHRLTEAPLLALTSKPIVWTT
jgi:DNA polymerase-1